ncbi:MAG TPA: hypothetical protein VJR92_00810 [Gemmatimonadaceae bacterium]|nr:hypothetical protein [Gemmatimonadaceae bacterium]
MKFGIIGARRGALPLGLFMLGALAIVAAPRVALAQSYFGKNSVQYDKLNWRELATEHFNVHYYVGEEVAARMTGQMAERSYARLSRIFNHQFREKKPIVVFASRGDFAQNNVFGDLGEGTGGVTDNLRQRNMFFFVGDLKEGEHVLAHEMVHQFQYDIFARGRAGLGGLGGQSPPLWFIEGMAEFLSIGPGHVATDAVLRDAAVNGDIPTIEQMSRRPDLYFPYRYGEGLLAYIAKRWGDDVIGEIMQATPAVGVESAIKRHTGLTEDELGEEWKETLQTQHLADLATRQRPRAFAQPILNERHTGGDNPVFVAPTLSPDGRQIVFLSTGSFARAEVFLDLYLADATTGKRIAKLTKSTLNPEFEELRAAYSQTAFSPDGRTLAFTAQREGRDVLYLYDVRRRRARGYLKTPLEQMIGPSFSPDGRHIVFSGIKGGLSNLYMIDADGRNLRQLTDDEVGDHQPQWSPDGQKVVFASERGPDTKMDVLRFGKWRISVLDLASGEVTVLPNQEGRNLNPMWAPDGQSVAYISDRTGTPNVFMYDFTNREQYQLTNVVGSIMSFTEMSPALTWAREADRMAFVYYDDGNYNVWAVDNPRSLKKQPFRTNVVASPVVADASRTTTGAQTPDGPGAAMTRSGLALAAAFDTSTARRLSVYRVGDDFRGAANVGDRYNGAAQSSVSVAALLDSASLALPDPATFRDKPYSPTLRAEYVDRPQLGYAQDNFGRGLYGGTTVVLADMLGNRTLMLSGSINGRIDEAQVFVGFASRANRFQYQTGFMQQPAYIFQDARQIDLGGGRVVNEAQITRFIIREGFFGGSYPLNRFDRIELGASVNSVERATQYLGQSIDYSVGYNSGWYVDSIVGRSTLIYGNPYVAYVRDNTLNGYTSPIYGRRMRLELGPTLGNVQWMHYAADYRRYDPIIFNYLTFATRVQADVSMGRDEQAFPKYIGRPYYVRGYDRGSYQYGQCGGVGSDPGACGATQLLGSRVAFANAELRFPLLRSGFFGPLAFALPPVEGLVFYDVGAAWSSSQSLYVTKPTNYNPDTQRYFLTSHGYGIRVNLFNFAILRWDYSIPHDAPGRKGFWVWTLGPSY